MFEPREIFELSNKNDITIREDRSKYYDYVKYLGYFSRRKLSKLDNMSRDIIEYIERDSGWKYISHSFEYKSDFRYDSYTHDIKFVLNVFSFNGYSYSYNSKRGKNFHDKYGEILDRLFIIEKKIDTIYKENSKLIKDKKEKEIIDFRRSIEQTEIRKKENKDFLIDYSQTQADYFFSEYHLDGVLKLVKLLNDLDNSDNPRRVYNSLICENIPNRYKYNLIMWIATYSNIGQKLLDDFDRERNEGMIKMESPIDIEEIRMNNIIKFHL